MQQIWLFKQKYLEITKKSLQDLSLHGHHKTLTRRNVKIATSHLCIAFEVESFYINKEAICLITSSKHQTNLHDQVT